jgi:cell division septation protein DedD
MDDDLNTPVQNTTSEPSSFSAGNRPKDKSRKTILMALIIAAILLIGGGIFFLVTGGDQEASETPSPAAELVINETPAPTEEAEEAGDVDLTIDIQIQNGTGITGEATYLKGELEKAGYGNIEASNADKTDNTATVATYKSSVSKATRDNINAILEKTYSSVRWVSGSPSNADIQIITGLRKGATSKPSGTPVKSPTATPKTTPKATTSGSPSPTASPKSPTPTATTQ